MMPDVNIIKDANKANLIIAEKYCEKFIWPELAKAAFEEGRLGATIKIRYTDFYHYTYFGKSFEDRINLINNVLITKGYKVKNNITGELSLSGPRAELLIHWED